MPSASRIRRLTAEHEEMQALRDASPLITFAVEGTPPTRYSVSLSCTGLFRHGKEIMTVSAHHFEVLLLEDFPLLAPAIFWRTPIFHPNFFAPAVCLGDFWYPAWSLSEMCVAICEMVQYKTFNIYDPLDKQAAAWLSKELDENPARFPVDTRPVRTTYDFDIAASRK